ncbi:hypothetical protein P1X14_04215 [Sphingomonas sp. AOB5]|uniref:hypothetical protein n=1 Tax=Sphingomonas sp. AOB5 TaxID=3034017 RepID=UPI0023F9F0F2|nr:hypothetical protein [Sphingomonas sp. AOB5]MDF7774441.1 hypothetical protein [Sphingomonas sp. AOB5]
MIANHDRKPARLPVLVRTLCGLAAVALVAACSPQGNVTNGAEDVPVITEVNIGEATGTVPLPDNGAPAGNVSSETEGGDGSAIVLSTLTAVDIEGAKLDGELACSFATSTGVSPLLLAKGNAGTKDPSFGVVKVGDYVEAVSAPGGFNAMVRGATFAGKGKTVRIAPTGAKVVGGGESPAVPATLTYDRADGAKRVIEGFWTCGP